jgi:hypothetical protein
MDHRKLSQKVVVVEKKRFVEHKRIIQKGKVETTSFLPCESLRIWISKK